MIRRLLPFVAIFFATLAVVVAIVVYLRLDGQDENLNGSRVEIARESCQAQNDRHDATLKKLDELIAALPPGPEKQRAEANKAGTVLLIDALAPKRDCGALVKEIRNSLD